MPPISPTDEWSKEQCLKLIKEFRANPILWDEKDQLYFQKNLKPAIWEKIGQSLDKNAEACRHKMMILLSSFRREKAKIKHSMDNDRDSSTCNYKSKWFAFKDMKFLMDKSIERKRLAKHTEDMEPTPKKSSNSSSTYGSTSRQVKMEQPSSAVVHKEIIDQTHINNNTNSLNPDVIVRNFTERDEELKSFTSFIYNKMRQYPDSTKNAVQQEICQIIFKADQKCYDTPSYDKIKFIDDPDKSDCSLEFQDTPAIIKIQNDFFDSE